MMDFRRTAAWMGCVLLALGSAAGPGYASDESAHQVQHLLKEEKVELDKLRGKIRNQNKKLKEIGKEENRVLKTLENLGDLAQMAPGIGAVGVDIGLAWIEPQRLVEVLDRSAVVAL